MVKMRPYVPSSRIAVRDSIDDDLSDDVDDDVFIKDARSAKLNEEKGLKRPLMAPRRKNGRTHSSAPIMKKHYQRRCWRCCEPFCYGLAALITIVALISLAALILTMFPIPLQKIKVWWKYDSTTSALMVNGKVVEDSAETDTAYGGREFVPCTQISVQKLWSRTFPRMNSESPIRQADLNGDGIKDVIFGYGVDDNIEYEGIALPKCKSAKQGDDIILPCEGGVIAINGSNGNLLWQTWSVANVFSLLCTLDINGDGYLDCVAAGRLGMIFAINGRNGNNIWDFHELEVETNSPILMDLYTINVVRDLDGDQIPDILAAHLEERSESKAGHIKVISGRTGKVIRSIPTPLREEVFVPLQLVTREDGTEVLLIVTGGQNTPGGVYSIRLHSLMEFTSEKEFTPLFQLKETGVMVPSVITDLTGDGVADIVVSSFKSVVYAFDGRNFSQLWNYSFPDSECVSAIVPGHFNHDNVSDFMVKYNMGPGYPVYYYSQTTILDGKTGKPLLDAMMTDSGGSNSLLGGISISQTFGGDFFLHWQMQCRDRYDVKEAYKFIPDSDLILQSRADTCRLRYNESTVVKLYAIARHVEPPGAVIFSSDDLEVHLNRTQHQDQQQKLEQQEQHQKQQQKQQQVSSKSPLKHPKMLKKLLANRNEILKNVANLEAAEKLEQTKRLQSQQMHNKDNILRKQFMEQELLPEFEQNNELPLLSNTYEQPKAYLGDNGLYGTNSQLRDFKDYESGAARAPEDYDILYNDNEVAQIPENERPIRLRSKYPGNRDVRSDLTSFEDETNSTLILPTGGVVKNSLDKQEPLSLWDLEMEKEERDAIKDSLTLKDASLNKKSHRRRTADTVTQPTETEESGNASDMDEWYLPSISSMGVLMQSLNNTKSSLDFAFILNVRESETFPPLFLKQDNDCVQEKMSAYKSFTTDNNRLLRKQLLKQCLKERDVQVIPNLPQFESQLVITRIGISCTCRSLQPGEICSELEDMHSQRWTEFMGNDGNGFYAN